MLIRQLGSGLGKEVGGRSLGHFRAEQQGRPQNGGAVSQRTEPTSGTPSMRDRSVGVKEGLEQIEIHHYIYNLEFIIMIF